MSLSKSKCWYSNSCLHFLKHAVPLKSLHPSLIFQEWYDELLTVSLELSNGQLIKNMTMYPTTQITLVHPEMTREFEQACQVNKGSGFSMLVMLACLG